MADNSSIEWTDATWNPVVGCSIVSPGCTNCYAMREAHRLGSNPKLKGKYAGLIRVVNGNPVWTGTVRLHEDALLQPLAWKKPRRIFVNSMSDLFHEGLRDQDIDRVFAVMALCPQHTFQVLTKRSFRMREYFSAPSRLASINGAIWSFLGTPRGSKIEHGGKWRAELPLPNVWLGVSAEDQGYAEMRIPDLLATPAAVRFVSCEPLLGAIELDRLPRPPSAFDRAMPGFDTVGQCVTDTLEGTLGLIMADDGREYWEDPAKEPRGPRLDWVIAGGESGPKARPTHPDWLRSLRDQCVRAGVPFFFKQWGEWAHDVGTVKAIIPPGIDKYIEFDGVYMGRLGKKKAGATLDGRTWREFPQASSLANAGEVSASLPTEGS